MASDRRKVLRFFEEQTEFMNDRITSGIELYRKGWFTLKVKKDGKLVPSAKIEIRQKNHEFKYGSNLFALCEMGDKLEEFKRLYADCFNLATLPFYWGANEPEKGEKRYEKGSRKIYRRPTIEDCLEFCEQYGVEPKVHCLEYDTNIPKWVGKSLEEIRSALCERFEELSRLYSHRIRDWEVTNENLFLPDYDQSIHNSPHFLANDTIEWDFKTVARYFPKNRLIINESGDNIWRVFNGNRSQYYMLIERALRNGCRIDSIGMQYHCTMKEEQEATIGIKMYNPEMIYKVLDCYADFGLPIQITELSIPTYRYTEEDEDIQAEILKNLYSIWFSHPNVEAIINWDFVDGLEWTPHKCGFVRGDLTPKKSYYVIRDLFQKVWRTNSEVITNDDGLAKVKAFYGNYEIIVTDGEITKSFEISMNKNSDREVTLVL